MTGRFSLFRKRRFPQFRGQFARLCRLYVGHRPGIRAPRCQTSLTGLILVHKVKRKLTTIFCADVVGYSRLMGADEHGTLVRLKQCRELMQAFIERHHGRVVSWSGDAVLADFSSVVESVQCAVEIQRELKAQNEASARRERMDFRIGINLGDVMIDDHDIFGEGVNIASRLQSLATPGGILISGSVHDQVKNKLALGFNFMGHQQVKNITEQVPVFVVAHDGSPSLAVRVRASPRSGVAPAVAAKAPALLPLRFGAGVIDVLVACALTFAIAPWLQGRRSARCSPSMHLSRCSPRSRRCRPICRRPTSRTAANVVRTTTRSTVERNYFGLRAADLSPHGCGVDRRPARPCPARGRRGQQRGAARCAWAGQALCGRRCRSRA